MGEEGFFVIGCSLKGEAYIKEEGGKLEEDNREREKGSGMRARRLYVAIKFNIITSQTKTKAGNKQDISKDCDLGPFILPVYLFCTMVQFTRREWGKGART